MPLEEVFDPTGAGDTFAGGFMGSLAAAGKVDDAAIARAIIYGQTVASFSVEEFSLDRLLTAHPGRDQRALRTLQASDALRRGLAAVARPLASTKSATKAAAL